MSDADKKPAESVEKKSMPVGTETPTGAIKTETGSIVDPKTGKHIDPVTGKPKGGRPVGSGGKKRRKSSGRSGGTASAAKTAETAAPPLPVLDFLSVLFELLAVMFGDHWKAERKELEPLAVASDAMLEKYLPATAEWGTEIAFTVALIAVVGPRIGETLPEMEEPTDEGRKAT